MTLPIQEVATTAGVNPFVKDLVQIFAWMAAIGTGIITAVKVIREMKEARRQRAEEMRWRKAELAKSILDKFESDNHIRDAMTMLDWSGREYETAKDIRKTIMWEDLAPALRIHDAQTRFTDKEVYIRDCFDGLFGAMELMEHYLRTKLLDFADVRFPMKYTVDKIRGYHDVVSKFLKEYGYELAPEFLARFG